MCDLMERFDFRDDTRPLGDYAVFMRQVAWAAQNNSNSIFKRAGLGDVTLRLLKAQHLAFSEVEETASVLLKWSAALGWKGKTRCYGQMSTLIAQCKRR